MSNKNRYVSSIGFTDLLFNMVVGLAFLFILAFVLINPITKQNDVEVKSDFLVFLSWDDDSGDDIDLWIRDPDGNLLSFRNREAGLMHLDRDDLGLSNDTFYNEDGTKGWIYINKEVASLRGFRPGEYLVNVHVYNRKPDRYGNMNELNNIQVELIKLNPYKPITTNHFVSKRRGQEFTAFKFTLDEDGKVISVDKPLLAEKLIGSSVTTTLETQAMPLESTTFNQYPAGW